MKYVPGNEYWHHYAENVEQLLNADICVQYCYTAIKAHGLPQFNVENRVGKNTFDSYELIGRLVKVFASNEEFDKCAFLKTVKPSEGLTLPDYDFFLRASKIVMNKETNVDIVIDGLMLEGVNMWYYLPCPPTDSLKLMQILIEQKREDSSLNLLLTEMKYKVKLRIQKKNKYYLPNPNNPFNIFTPGNYITKPSNHYIKINLRAVKELINEPNLN